MIAKRSKASLQTHHALQASDLAAAINEAIKKVCIAPGDYVPELTEPQGPSTAGGVLAMQHLRLVPRQAGQPTVVVGHANHAEGKAELRSFEHVDAIHRQRFQRPLTLDRVQYDEFLGLAKLVFGALHLQTVVTGPPADLDSETPPLRTPRGVSKVTAAVVVTIVLLALAIGTWALFGKG
jgi:hypothetical protein